MYFIPSFLTCPNQSIVLCSFFTVFRHIVFTIECDHHRELLIKIITPNARPRLQHFTVTVADRNDKFAYYRRQSSLFSNDTAHRAVSLRWLSFL